MVLVETKDILRASVPEEVANNDTAQSASFIVAGDESATGLHTAAARDLTHYTSSFGLAVGRIRMCRLGLWHLWKKTMLTYIKSNKSCESHTE